jgi:hypothetical protein
MHSAFAQMTLMQTRAAMYARFVRRKVTPVASTAASTRTTSTKDDAEQQQRQHRLDVLLMQSAVSRRMQELMGDYVALEEYYMDACLRKAMQMYGLTAVRRAHECVCCIDLCILAAQNW